MQETTGSVSKNKHDIRGDSIYTYILHVTLQKEGGSKVLEQFRGKHTQTAHITVQGWSRLRG